MLKVAMLWYVVDSCSVVVCCFMSIQLGELCEGKWEGKSWNRRGQLVQELPLAHCNIIVPNYKPNINLAV